MRAPKGGRGLPDAGGFLKSLRPRFVAGPFFVRGGARGAGSGGGGLTVARVAGEARGFLRLDVLLQLLEVVLAGLALGRAGADGRAAGDALAGDELGDRFLLRLRHGGALLVSR